MPHPLGAAASTPAATLSARPHEAAPCCVLNHIYRRRAGGGCAAARGRRRKRASGGRGAARSLRCGGDGDSLRRDAQNLALHAE
eukprot:6366496-Prymnesium_polylepis.2